MGDICPICRSHPGDYRGGNYQYVECNVCRGLHIDDRLMTAPTTLDDWCTPFCAARELREIYERPATIHFNGSVTCHVGDGREHTIKRFPTSIPERAHKLLSALVTKSRYFGQQLPVLSGEDYPLAYVDSAKAFVPYVEYLAESDLVRIEKRIDGGCLLRVCASGIAAVEEARLLPEKTVFLCSTCYDLRDCRCELTEHIESLGCLVRASDDPLKFDVSPTKDSIQSCLLNVAHSDSVFCIIDQRYGPPLLDGEYAGKSAAHAEVQFARSKDIPIYFFIRREAYTEWSILKGNPKAKTKWVEPTNTERRKRWTEFVTEYLALPKEKQVSNWVDQFDSIVDLKKIVRARLRALQSDRV